MTIVIRRRPQGFRHFGFGQLQLHIHDETAPND